MIYYFLPDPGIFGGVKVACQFMDMLLALGAKGNIVLAQGKAPEWFTTSVPIMNEKEAFERIGPDDWIVITWPPDHQRLQDLPGKMICHCQGTDPLMDPIFADESVPLLTCWQQAEDYVMHKFRRSSIAVGISISNCFYWDGTVKLDNRIAYMPRRGFPLVRRCIRECKDLDFIPLYGLHERKVGEHLKKSGVFLATAVGGQFGLPALEAMAAGCLVISVPVKGGMEYLEDKKNCLMVEPDEMPSKLKWIMEPKNSNLRFQLRSQALTTAYRYRAILQKRHLQKLVRTSLQELVS